ncbi:type I-E CRISPR-associated protein Cse1/CasA [Streptomyces sp. NBC_01601]|uniref:type I-E CRISPR-associated protein Cse1/CasA n=1 Tax=Streptomyces sp. NBC_01601 TaxID=2975892 RepID=UPI002E2CAFF2|nr:type I-E CRISPR-associated protein Cse1/CasA [Streptomyces sp. NBC_01601]
MTAIEPTGTTALTTASFDLTSQPWIGVLRTDGSQTELSLREIFARAGELRYLMGELATVEFALMRLLLAIAHDALDGPREMEDWGDLWEDADCFAPVAAYLDQCRDRFDLLHSAAPFFQTAGLRTQKDEVFSLSRIVADVPTGDPFFTARMPGVDRLSFAEAARWVVHAHAYDTSGIKTGMVGDQRVRGGKVYPLGTGWAGGLGGVFVEGDTLRETLLLNLIATDTYGMDFGPEDRPTWRREPCGPRGTERPATGPRDLYTWQSRRLRLHHDADGVHGVVLGYGDPLASRNTHQREPMTAWRRSTAQEKKLRRTPVYLPKEHAPSRSPWRGLAALVADRAVAAQGEEPAAFLRPGVLEWIARLVTEGSLSRHHLVRARVVGAVYGTQQSVIDDIVDDRLTMPVVLLHRQDQAFAQQAVGAAEDADGAIKALGDLAADLARAVGSDSPGPSEAAKTAGFAALEDPYRRWLIEMANADDPFAHRVAWQSELRILVRLLAERLVTAAGDAAWQGRIVSDKKGAVWLNAGHAEKWFRARIARLLPTPADDGRASSARPASGAEAATLPTPRPGLADSSPSEVCV